ISLLCPQTPNSDSLVELWPVLGILSLAQYPFPPVRFSGGLVGSTSHLEVLACLILPHCFLQFYEFTQPQRLILDLHRQVPVCIPLCNHRPCSKEQGVM
ncbi:325_t:CDS:2, partial [Cetraspora pellucida]